MKAFSATAVLLLALASPLGGQEPDSAADREAIRAVIERTEAANNAGDVEAWVALFDDGAVYMAPGSPTVDTREGLVEIARMGFRHQADIDIQPVEIRVAGEWAFARSRVTGTVTLADSGDVVEVDTRQIAIYHRDGQGRWRIARLIMNRPD
jgi:uncharacterized protein (TIGR02246 family)